MGAGLDIFYEYKPTLEEVLKAIGRNIRKFRKEQRMSQEELAEKARIKSSSYISRLEKGKQNVSIKVLKKISDALSIRLPELFPLSILTASKLADENKRSHIISELVTLAENNPQWAKEVVKFINMHIPRSVIKKVKWPPEAPVELL